MNLQLNILIVDLKYDSDNNIDVSIYSTTSNTTLK